jgi:7-cyano-7-deazaguanine reductase
MELKHLGHQVPHTYTGADPELLDKIPVPVGKAAFDVTIKGDEFTCVCPATGGPDFGEIEIRILPDKWLVESKSLKLYLESYRQHPIFHEAAVVKICDDLFELIQPRSLEVHGHFKPRGGWAIWPIARRKTV